MLEQLSFQGNDIDDVSFTISPLAEGNSIFLKHISIYSGNVERRQSIAVYGALHPDLTDSYQTIAAFDIPMDGQGGVIPFTLQFTEIFPHIIIVSSANVDIGVKYEEVSYAD